MIPTVPARAPSTSLSAGSFDVAQGWLLRPRSAQAPSTSLRAGPDTENNIKTPLKKTIILKIVTLSEAKVLIKIVILSVAKDLLFCREHHRPPPISTREAMSAGLL
jgi:hypothetical protein